MRTIKLVSEDKVSPLTRRIRWSHYGMGQWLCATQFWAWRGGDAIVVPARDMKCFVAIRQGKEVRVVEATGFNQACEMVGMYHTKFQIR